MISLSSLLNPEPPGPRSHPSPTVSPSTSYSETDTVASVDRPMFTRIRARETGRITKPARSRGLIKYHPFEDLDEASAKEVAKFQVTPFGRIRDSCAHIPYNSGKKDFFDKTGRESFEGRSPCPRCGLSGQRRRRLTPVSSPVFKYDFKPPGDDNEYTVMWDYNIGLVRMTPFFKCCQYSKVCNHVPLLHIMVEMPNTQKTMPGKMLNMNPGLKDITHSITGGAILAQGKSTSLLSTAPRHEHPGRRSPSSIIPVNLSPPGYWMPYNCAKAVCATFCYKIAGALIPIFGPSFPSICAPPDSPEYGRMTINPSIIASATREAELNRRHHLSLYTSRSDVLSASNSPRRRTPARSTPERHAYQTNGAAFQHQARLGRHGRSSCSPYYTDSDEGYRSVPDTGAGSWSPNSSSYLYASQSRSSGWTPANKSVPVTPLRENPVVQPWASSIPRFAPPGNDPRLRPWKGHRGKRFVEDGSDGGYDGGTESQANSPSMGDGKDAPDGDGKRPMREEALLLLNLRSQESAVTCAERAVEGLHKAKRRRACSM